MCPAVNQGLGLPVVAFLLSLSVCMCAKPHRCLREQRQKLPLHRAGHACFLLADVNIHFAADSKLPQIDSRLNRCASARNQMAAIARFESIHVDPVSVDALADAVARAMKKVLAISGIVN